MKITLCASCAAGNDEQAGQDERGGQHERSGLAAPLRAALAEQGLTAAVALVDCMSGCTRPVTIAFRSPEKTAYLFGDITPADLPDLITFARLYAATPDGNLTDARPLGALRLKVIARIPG